MSLDISAQSANPFHTSQLPSQRSSILQMRRTAYSNDNFAFGPIATEPLPKMVPQEHRANHEKLVSILDMYYETPPILFVPPHMQYTPFGVSLSLSSCFRE